MKAKMGLTHLEGKCIRTNWETPCYKVISKNGKRQCQKSRQVIQPMVFFIIKKIFTFKKKRFARINFKENSQIALISVGDIVL